MVLLILALPCGLGGCAVAVVGGLAAAGGAGYAAGQERGVNGIAADHTIKTDFENALIRANPHLQAGIDTTVYQGRMLLTGRVSTPAEKAEAGQIAEHTRSVRAVYNEIEVAPPESFWHDARDTWISTRIRSQMVLDPKIRSLNYSIDTVNGSVYLIGSARSRDELGRVLRIARYVPGVKRVVSYVDIRTGVPVDRGYGEAMAPPAPMTGPDGGMPIAPGPTVPASPIEVQKL
jgi:osmotically-inducible protein OsmY